MRRLLSILLLAIFGLPLVSPLLVLGAVDETSFPVCCRRNGTHHCTMPTVERTRLAPPETTLQSPQERCPFSPGTMVAGHTGALALPAHQTFFPFLAGRPPLAPTVCARRILRNGSQRQRGPPVGLL